MKNLDQLHNEAPILKNSVELYKEYYQYLKTFPKKDQHMLGKRCESHIITFIEHILIAVGVPKDQKLRVLLQANSKFDVLKVLIRMMRELKILDNRKYLSLEGKIQNIGRMLGGWIKSLR